jgi:HEAT repeat protein
LGERKPNIKSLVHREDVEGLAQATSYQASTPSSAGTESGSGVQVRAQAIRALGTLAPELGHQAIAAGLRDSADEVRCAAVRVLHALHEGSLLAEALGWLPADEGHSRTLAIQAIVDLRKSVRATTIANALVHREDDYLLGEHDVELILGLLEDEGAGATDEAIDLLVRALDDDRGIVVDRAAEMLLQLDSESTEALAAELRSGPAAANAAYVLGRIGDPQTLEGLVKALRHSDPKVRAESAAALAELQDPAAVKPLLRATHDKEHAVRSQAGVALDRLGTTGVIAGLASLLQPIVGEAVQSAIGHSEVVVDDHTHPPRSSARNKSRARPSKRAQPSAADTRATKNQDAR